VTRSIPILLLAAAAGCAPAAVPAASPPAAPAPVAAPADPAAAELEALFADHWESVLRENPVFATSVGDRRNADRLEAASLADVARRTAETRAFLERLRAIPRDRLPEPMRVHYDIFEIDRRNELEAADLRLYLIPITNRQGFHTSFPELGERVPLNTPEDYRNYTARLRDFRRVVDEYVEVMREGIRTGMVLPAVSVVGIEETLLPHVVDDPTASLLYAPFTRFPAGVPPAAHAELAAAGRQAIAQSVVPGYAEFLRFMREEYVPAARATIGASDLPNGREIYAQRVRFFTTLPLTPEEVHATGLAEVARIRAEMEDVIRTTGFQGTFAEFLHFLRTDPQFYVDTPEELMQRTALVLKRMDGELPRLFGHLPRMPYGLREIPDYIAPRTTTAYYTRPAGDGTRAGFYWLNTYDLPSRPTYEIEALSLHEAVPGHHLQIAIQQELDDLPEFRRFGGATVFTEGWALYAERLGKEVGFYTDPYSDFGRLVYEMWRATRLVVDTGLHWEGWTRQRAIDYMAENTALTLLNITNEVDRYISWPGQALAYKPGEMKITELRREAERELGDRFDVRAFHDVVLGSGALPLTVLEANVRAWIARTRPG
jgi:uncharacterized protein (DUF885 family)